MFLKIELDESVAAASATSFCKHYRRCHALTRAEPVGSVKLAQISALRDRTQYLSTRLEAEDVSKNDNDRLREEYKATTRALAAAVQRHREFERSVLFARYESLRRLRIAATAPQQVLAASKAAAPGLPAVTGN